MPEKNFHLPLVGFGDLKCASFCLMSALLTSRKVCLPHKGSLGLKTLLRVFKSLSRSETVSTSANLFFNFLSHFCQLLSETIVLSSCGKSFSWTAFISKPHFNESNAKMIPFFIYFILYSIIIYFIALIYFSRVNFKLNINKSTKKSFFLIWMDKWMMVSLFLYDVCNNGLINWLMMRPILKSTKFKSLSIECEWIVGCTSEACVKIYFKLTDRIIHYNKIIKVRWILYYHQCEINLNLCRYILFLGWWYDLTLVFFEKLDFFRIFLKNVINCLVDMSSLFTCTYLCCIKQKYVVFSFFFFRFRVTQMFTVLK